MGNTNIPVISQAQWVDYLLNDGVPLPWTDDEGKEVGGTLDAILQGMGSNLERISAQVNYAFLGSRIQTATDTMLDLCSQDYYGDELPRNGAESDDSYRSRILAGLLVPKVTEPGISLLITNLTGKAPRMIQPWNPVTTGAYGRSYYNADSAEIPALYGDNSLRWQGGIITSLPQTNAVGAIPVWGYDMGAAYNEYTGVYWKSLAANFLSETSLFQLIAGAKAMGVKIWIKTALSGLVSWIVGNSFTPQANKPYITVSIRQFVGPYIVLLSGSWMSNYFVQERKTKSFVADFSSPTPPTGMRIVNQLAIPYTIAGSSNIPIQKGAINVPITIPANTPSNRLTATPSWETQVWIQALSSTSVTLGFSTPAPAGGSVALYFWPADRSASAVVAPGSNFVPIPSAPAGVPFVTPSWNTQVAVQYVNGVLTAFFNTSAPANAFCHWGVF